MRIIILALSGWCLAAGCAVEVEPDGDTAASADAGTLDEIESGVSSSACGCDTYYPAPTRDNGGCSDTAFNCYVSPRKTCDGARLLNRATCQESFPLRAGATFSDGTTSCTQTREVHYVDAAGTAARVDLARTEGLGGAALWALGYDSPATWSAIGALARPDNGQGTTPSTAALAG